jgi:hypothetical protein
VIFCFVWLHIKDWQHKNCSISSSSFKAYSWRVKDLFFVLYCFAVSASCLVAKTLWIALCNVNNWLYINYQLPVCLFVAHVAPCSRMCKCRSCSFGKTFLKKLLTLFWKLGTGDAQKCDWGNHTWGNPIAHRKPSLGGNPVGKKFIAHIYILHWYNMGNTQLVVLWIRVQNVLQWLASN